MSIGRGGNAAATKVAKVQGYIPENGTRAARGHNIAVAMKQMIAKYPQVGATTHAVSARELRHSIRIKLELPSLLLMDSKLADGDLRAHGDALGKHLLNLQCEGKGADRKVLLNSVNLKKCTDFLDKRVLIQESDREPRVKLVQVSL